ncbi:Putative 115 kDa protein in type-1 retrotransposable element R1DM [Eumeta japonica]|uniref:115 kDa protein in type-1 retrotransposable element R1DM n=1 Tax=Eumeta variegata TaxID=151549 RepID=A0A4C1YHI3_EUMVA|nr:Putative 115 kDa protein in type-1 retrotransposable element R1DM [Eumeta japonica]
MSLDIEGAFDNAWLAGVGDSAACSKLPSKPQWHGSGIPSRPGGYRQAFADDVVLMFSEQSASSIEEEVNRALACVHCWGVRNKLRFTPSKTNSIVLTKKLKYDDQVVRMNGEQISLVGEIRFLGLTIDRTLAFIPHVAKASKKVANIYKCFIKAKTTWGLSPEVVRTIYITVIEPIVLYASCTWAPATRKLGVQKMLDAVQRSVALKACWANSIMSLHSTLILVGLLFLDIRLREAAWLYEMKRGKDLGDNFVHREFERLVYFGDLPHPAHVPKIGHESVEDMDSQTLDRLAVVGPHIYTDGSRIEGKVLRSKANLYGIRRGRTIPTQRARKIPFSGRGGCDVSTLSIVAMITQTARWGDTRVIHITPDRPGYELIHTSLEP